MRYYEIYLPNSTEPGILTSVRSLKRLPKGTTAYLTITDRDGSLIEQVELPVEGGRVKVAGRGKHRPKLHHG